MEEIKLVKYQTVKFEQIWSAELWLNNTAVDAIAQVFGEFAQIGWLVELGYKPQVHKWHDIASDNMHLCYEFLVRQEDLTFMLLKWPQAELTIDYDRMLTKMETIDG